MNIKPKAPLFRDPIYDGAADPVIIWNKQEEDWWMFYTNRRAWGPCIGESYMHGSEIGVASSSDDGKTWDYRGTLQNLDFEPGKNTFWAPEIIEYEGMYHMYVSYVRGVPTDWDRPRSILHYTSRNLWDWEFQSTLTLSSDRVIDACVIRMPDHTWKMWYKDEIHHSYSYSAVSEDLYHWEVVGPEITDCPHEGPNVFYFKDRYWMITDPWDGLGVYVSDDAACWKRCENILREGGVRNEDCVPGAHADVLVHNDRAYIFYFTRPNRQSNNNNSSPHGAVPGGYEWNRTSIQVAELTVENDRLICDRNHVQYDLSR